MAFVLGKDCKAYYNTGTFATPTWSVIDNVSTLKSDMKSDTGEGTRRASGRFKQFAATLIDLVISWKMLWDLTDAAFLALWNAFKAGTEVDMIFLDGVVNTGVHQGPRISAALSNFGRSEDEKGILTVDVEAHPGILFVPVWFTGT